MLTRPRLFKTIDRANARLVWVSGPPGAGKTTLLSTYVTARKFPALWYQLDGGDNDVAAFFYYLREALAKYPKSAGLPLLTPEYLPDLKGFGRRYFRALFGMLPRRAVLVLDNYQELDQSSALHSVLREVFAEIPEGVRFLVASRSAPPPEYARLIAAGTLAPLDWEELRLTREEIEAVASHKRRVGGEELDALCAQCDGWAAGLVLLLEQRARQKTQGATPSTSPQTVFDYFASEIFSGNSPEMQDFLLRTAFLPQIKPGLAAALSGNDKAEELLDWLYRRHLFTNRSETAFQFHPLLREFLLARARATFSKTELAELARRAAELLESDGQIAEAAQLYREAGDWTRLERLICEQAGSLLAQGRHTTLEAWIAAVPEPRAEASQWLLYWRGMARVASDPAQGRDILERAYARFKAGGDPEGSLLACAAVLETYDSESNEFKPADKWISELEALMNSCPDRLPAAVEARVLAASTTIVYRQPRHPLLGRFVERALQLFHAAADAGERGALAQFLLLFFVWRGEYQQARAIVESVKGRLDPNRVLPLHLLNVKAWELVLAHQLAEHDTGLRVLEEALTVSRESGVHLMDGMFHGNGVYLALSMGDLEMAEEGVQRMQAPSTLLRPHDFNFLSHLRSGIALMRGDFASAQREAQAAVDGAERGGTPFQSCLARIGLALALIERNEQAAARQELAWIQHLARETLGDAALSFIASLLEAHSWLREGDDAKALAALRAGLAIGREHDYMNVNPFWMPEVMSRLCALALEHGIETEYVIRLIKKRGLVAPSPEAVDWPWPVKVYTLGRFSVLIDGKPLQSSGKAQRKPLELLMALVAFGGRDVSESQLTETLWPDAEGDAAHEACAITLHRLRKLLGHDQAISLQRNHFSLDPCYVWVDVWAFERWLAPAQGDAAGRRASEKAIALYQGPFLGKHADLSWALLLRERLRSKFLRHLVQWSRGLFEAKEFEAAVVVLEKGLNVDPLAEEFYRDLMLCYQALGRRAEATGVYQRCQKILGAVLGVSPATVALYQSFHR